MSYTHIVLLKIKGKCSSYAIYFFVAKMFDICVGRKEKYCSRLAKKGEKREKT